ncbi:MAG: DDE-type integrase/transposase/recombinase [Verrucomicrobiota bacterium]
MDQRREFVIKALERSNFRELCREYGISAKTGYKWKERFMAYGLEGMAEESRRPRSHAKELRERVVCEIVRLKKAHSDWGPRKIRTLYERLHGAPVPSESSFKRVLERAGLTQPRKRRRAKQCGRLASGRQGTRANEVWSVDFKGWWWSAHGKVRVEPLTVRDEYSRMILEIRVMGSSRTEAVQSCFERLFERYGLPEVMRSDNGVPFASTRSPLGLSRLSAWWVALGIDLERNRPGCPQDNAAHERMHLDIRNELEVGRIGRDQDAFDLWREQFNSQRPHEALGMATPSEFYKASPRRFEGTPDELDYAGMESRRVHPTHGTITYQRQRYAISQALRGWQLGLKPIEDGLVELYFANLLLGHLEPSTRSFRAARPGRPEADQTKRKA